MRYREIEYYGHHSMFDRNVTVQMEARTGMKTVGQHMEWADLQEDTYEETVSYLEAVGCPLIAVPRLGGDRNIGHNREQGCRDVWLCHLDWLNQLYEKLSARGFGPVHHNHNREFLLNYNGQKALKLLFNNLRSEIMMEFDTGGAVCVGEDCCQTLRQYSFREALLHLKPYSNITGYESFLDRPGDCNNVREILRAYEGNFDWTMLEGENRAVDEMENVKRNFEHPNLILGDVQKLYIGVLVLPFHAYDAKNIFGGFVLKEHIEECAITIVNYIIDHNTMVRQTVKKFGISESMVHKDAADCLGGINPSLVTRAQVVLNVNKSERHIRDDMTTKEKYQRRLQICSNDEER